jgi:hypothetical protein
MAVQDPKPRVARMTGTTGQDGACLNECLPGLGNTVRVASGAVRHRSTPRLSMVSIGILMPVSERDQCEGTLVHSA